jgi:two-component system response regulator HydG
MKNEELSRYFGQIINHLKDGVMVVDTQGNIVMVNPAMARMSGFSEEEMVDSPCTILDCDACELLRSEANKLWCGLFVRQSVHKKHCTVTRKDGTYVSAIKDAVVLKREDGLAVGALEIYSDLSELEEKNRKILELFRLLNKNTMFNGMVGQSSSMQKVFQLIEKVSKSDSTVLISGESGTGKELVANAIHKLGKRENGPFIKLNCAALNESILESELFGHVKGAFTGAYRHRKGLFEEADGGEILLDEIGDIPLSTQVKLLRLLETKQFVRIGGNRPVSVDVRIIAATNRNLPDMVSKGLFREDLFFRINIVPINVPPLRERKEDIPLLVSSFIDELCAHTGQKITGLAREVLDGFMHYPWPGNVRELRSALEYAFLVCESRLIETDHLPPQFQHIYKSPGTEIQSTAHVLSPVYASNEKRELVDALRQTCGNQTQASKILGVHRMTVWNRMRKYGISLKGDILS